MKKLLLATTILATMSTAALAADIKLGIIVGFTGPIESLTPGMADGAELAWNEASASGLLLDGSKIISIRGDSTCIDSAAATAVAERQITSENVAAIMGADCSGVTGAIANNVAVANGVVMISPSATSPALTALDDKGFFFRTAPSDARQGQVLAEIVTGRGIKNVAITFTNNDYGKGLEESFSTAFKKLGGSIAISAAHEDGKGDYSAEVAALAASGASELVVFGYVDQGGKGIIQSSLDTGAFERFIFADGMVGDALIEAFGDDLKGSFGTRPGADADGIAKFHVIAKGTVAKDGKGPFDGNSYDAAALIALAMQAAGSADRAGIQSKVMEVANAPGEKIYPGELAKALKIIKDGGNVDYQGATGVEFNAVGEVFGSYNELEIDGKAFNTVKVH